MENTASDRHGPARSVSARSVVLLNRALATELVCMFRYRNHLLAARDVYGPKGCEAILRQAEEEARHAERIAHRIIELGGAPDLRLGTLAARSYVDYDCGTADPLDVFLPALLEEDLLAEEIAADAYREIIDELRDRDPETCALLMDLVVAEEKHAAGLDRLLHDPAAAVPPIVRLAGYCC